MRKAFSIFIFIIIASLILFIFFISTFGIETARFNNFISQKINQKNNDINLKFTTIKFKLDVKDISLFLETIDPKIKYRNILFPSKNIKVYINILSLIKSEPSIKKINISLDKIDVKQLKRLSIAFKPSNLTSFINNKIVQGHLQLDVDLYFDNKNKFKDFIARGSANDLKTKITKDLKLEKTDFSFFADKSDILIKNFSGESKFLQIKEGDLKLKLSPVLNLQSNFKTILKFNNNLEKIDFLNDIKYAKYLKNLNAELNNNLSLQFDKTYKVMNYDYKVNGKILKAVLERSNPIEIKFLENQMSKLSLVDTSIKIQIDPNKRNTNFSGKYSINDDKFLNINFENVIKKDSSNFLIDVDYDKLLNLNFINYKKEEDKIANISVDLNKRKNDYSIKKIIFTEGKNKISIEGLKLNRDKFLSLDKILVKTYKNDLKNNDFLISYGKNIKIKGNQFDASNLPKILNETNEEDRYLNINKEIVIELSNIIIPLSEKLKNFKLIGTITAGKFSKISSKGDFGNNNFLDVTMKNDKENKKKYLEIYSDITKPLLSEFKFFKGLTGGKLLYSSIIDKNSSSSKLKIENFKVINAPGMVKLLSLADLGGLADLAEGEGISFEVLDITMEKNGDVLKLNEILALGPSISVLMDGYQDKNVTSLRGTLVPAKTLNKMISKIPVIGEIVIPKEVGEGLFGISFKMKGPPGEIKTTINPIRTITPRFIQKIVDRKKNIK